MANRILRSFSNTTTVNTGTPGYISLDVDLANYGGHSNSSSVSCGNVSINSTCISVGWDGAGNGMQITPVNLILGFQITMNSTMIAVGSGNGVRIANNSISVNDGSAANGNVYLNPGYIFCGNSTITASITPNTISVGNSTVNTSVHGGFLGSASVMTYPSNVGNLPSGPADGLRAFVNDATLPISNSAGANVVGGGSYHVPVYYDGGVSMWRIG